MMKKVVKDAILDKNIPYPAKGGIKFIALYSGYSLSLCFSPHVRLPFYRGSMRENDFITTMFRMNVDQHMVCSLHMISIIITGTLFLYHLLG